MNVSKTERATDLAPGLVRLHLPLLFLEEFLLFPGVHLHLGVFGLMPVEFGAPRGDRLLLFLLQSLHFLFEPGEVNRFLLH